MGLSNFFVTLIGYFKGNFENNKLFIVSLLLGIENGIDLKVPNGFPLMFTLILNI